MVLDAVDGNHSIPLDEESQLFTMGWGHFMYLRMTQGYLASSDTYTCRYDEIIKNVPSKVKIVDDSLLFDKNIEEAFYDTVDYLLLYEKNGIVLNRDKFQFCVDVVQFGGLQSVPFRKFAKCNLQFPGPQKYH